MKRKLIAILLALAAVLALPGAASAAPTVRPEADSVDLTAISVGAGPVSNTTGGLGNHTIQVCLDSGFYGGSTWNTAGNAVHARLYEAMQTLNGIYGQQAFIRSGPGTSYSCPGADKRLIMKRNVVAFPAEKMQYSRNLSSVCLNEPWGYTLYPVGCSSDKTITVNDWYLWYVGTGTPSPVYPFPTGAFDIETAFIHELIHSLGLPHHSGTCTTGQEQMMCANLLDATGDAPFYWRSLAAGNHDRTEIEYWFKPSFHQH